MSRGFRNAILALGAGLLLSAAPVSVSAQELKIGPNDIGGVVTGPNGPEAGVWVIAETFELGVRRFAKIVVTDDQGQYLIPDLPGAIDRHPDPYAMESEIAAAARGRAARARCQRRALHSPRADRRSRAKLHPLAEQRESSRRRGDVR